MSDLDMRLSPTRHAPGILGCAAVLLAAACGLWTSIVLTPGAPDARVLDRLAIQEAPRAAPQPDAIVAAGPLRGSFYESATAAGAPTAGVAEAVKLFSKKLDFARDLQPDDPFRLVFARVPAADGRTTRAGTLLYAEIGTGGRTTRFYRFDHDGRAEYLDAVGREPRPLLLRTPVDGARVTSGFGMRLHPILGFNRLHPGVDFGAPEGAPVLAAGDGKVEEVKWAAGYGHWLKLRHAAGFETGYGHLSRYAPGVKPGAVVKQGQVVAFVGSTGLSTGPHLHFEIMQGGRKLDPASAATPRSDGLDDADRAAFAAQKARIDRILGGGGAVLAAAQAPGAAPSAGPRAG